MDPKQVKWTDFKKHALPAHVLSEYWYCAPKIYVKKLVGEIETPLIIQGRKLHEQEAIEVIEKIGPFKRVPEPETVFDVLAFIFIAISMALRERKIIANSEEHILCPLVLPFGVVGVPDKVDCSNGEPIIVETKYKSKLPGKPWPDHELQLATYILGLETLGFTPPYGILRYVKREDPNQEKSFRIELNDCLRRKIEHTAESVRRILEGSEEPIPPKYPNKCRSCYSKYREACRWKLQ